MGFWPGAPAAATRLPLRRARDRATRRAAAGAVLALVAMASTISTPRQNDPLAPHSLGPIELVKFGGAAAGPTMAQAQSVPKAATPTAVINGHTATVNWSPTTLSGGTTAGGYIVRRYTSGHVLQAIGAGCTGTVLTNSCVEANVPGGTWQYTVQPVQGGWTGSESNYGASVTVATASLTFTSSTTVNSLPSTLNATIANFTAGSALTFHLDSATGPVLSGTPATVPTGGTGTVSVTIPAGTTDTVHSVFAVDGTGVAASAAITVVDPPDLVSLSMLDLDLNGKVDTVRATFDETLAAYTAGVAPWTLTNIPSAGSLSTVSVSGAVATLTLAEGSSAATTAVGTFKVALATNSAGVRDSNGNLATFAATTPIDAAAPAPLTMVMNDATANGKVDAVAITWSETIATYSAGTTPWTLTAAPSGATVASVTASGTTTTLTLTEGGGAVDTAVGSFTVKLTGSATSIRDAAGNQTGFTKAPTDGAKPIKVSQGAYDVNSDGYVDRVLVTFSEPLAPYTAGTGVWVFSNAPSGSTVSAASVSGAVATLDLTPGTGAASTAMGTFKIALSADSAGIRDAAGNQASYVATAPTDLAAPALLSLALIDNSGNGKVDRVTATFSETLTTYSAGNTPWTLTNVPSGGTLASVSRSGAVATLTLTEGPGAADTSVGSMTVALAANATGVRDAAGNLSSFGARKPLDMAVPVAMSITDTNGATDGKIEPGDAMVITYSEAITASAVPSSTTITIADPSGTGNDTINIDGISSGARSLGSNNYESVDGASAVFAGSTVSLSGGGTILTIVVGPTCAGTGCAALTAPTSAASLVWVSAPTLVDLAGNAPTTSTKTVSIKLF